MTQNFFLMLIFSLLITLSSFAETSPIRIFNWWDYLSPVLEKKIQANYPQMVLTEYRSNEVALSKLLNGQNEYDIAIVSNWVAGKLMDANVLEDLVMSSLKSKRNYTSIISKKTSCVPYLWSTSSFAFNNEVVSSVIDVNNLIKMNNESHTIGIIDDVMEFYTRVSIDNNCNEIIDSSCFNKIKKSVSKLSKKNFHSSLTKVLQSYDAVYSWHGVISETIEDLKTYKFSLPEKSPVIGGDYVCIMKNKKRSPEKLKELVKFVEFFTNKKNTNLNVKSTYYFSPYSDFSPELLPPKTAKLYKDLLKLMEKSPGVFIKDYSKSEIDEINKLWKNVRFRK